MGGRQRGEQEASGSCRASAAGRHAGADEQSHLDNTINLKMLTAPEPLGYSRPCPHASGGEPQELEQLLSLVSFLPHARGGEPTRVDCAPTGSEGAPRKWGWPSTPFGDLSRATLVPAHAGMAPLAGETPIYSPAHAGMNLQVQHPPEAALRKPHARGDEKHHAPHHHHPHTQNTGRPRTHQRGHQGCVRLRQRAVGTVRPRRTDCGLRNFPRVGGNPRGDLRSQLPIPHTPHRGHDRVAYPRCPGEEVLTARPARTRGRETSEETPARR